ncbi:uncharacterized protein PAN0_010c4037 [Moesziomyces antarcticus]|uniref:Uncharacterized protein n=2 Tax=Pseudozyma antarctica TaxID=84753 RepID=A0A5C3FM32_PSEA2|nr:uncharacterized protein PAN0_010c4037 [Moesziomyces antarcticus]GAK65816.1 conserved hypothetical protein [Moesziomyces antarcticus]SPO45444.1 uncharacterized protein PSANT_03130 [Moesziomyces antarcticus]
MPSAARPQDGATAAEPGTSALAAASITTSEQLVKTLRVPQTPANGISKVSIASEAWKSQEFFVPKKAELLSQWILEHLCSGLRGAASASNHGTPTKGKGKGKQQQQQQQKGKAAETVGPIELDLEAWTLLASIIAAQTGSESDLTEASKRSWLSHLANTQPTLQLAGALARQLEQAQATSDADRFQLLSAAEASLVKLLPPATSRTAATNVETATDAIHAWLEFFSQPRSSAESQSGFEILKSIVVTWATALQYGSNAKRNHHHFCTRTLPALVRALQAVSLQSLQNESAANSASALLELVKQIAAESLFTEDVHRSLLQAGRSAELGSAVNWREPKAASTEVVQQLVSFLHGQGSDDRITSTAALGSLPVLSELLYTRLSRSESLNSMASSSTTSAGSVRETQLALVRKTMLAEWLFPVLPFLVTPSERASQQNSADRAAARKGVLRGIERDSLYIIGCDEHEAWRSFFSTLFNDIRDDLSRIATDESESTSAHVEIADHFRSLTLLWRLEKSVVEDDLVDILAMAAVQPVAKPTIRSAEELGISTRAGFDFIREVAALDVRFRTLPALVNNIMPSLPLAAERLAGRGRELAESLYVSQTFLAELAKLCHDSVTAMQVPDLVNRIPTMVQNVGSALDALTVDTGKAAKRQRRASGGADSSAAHADTAALLVQLRIAATVVQSVNVAPQLRARSVAAAEELHNSLILPCLDAVLGSTRAVPASGVCGVAAAALQLRHSLLSEKWRYDPSEPVKLDGSLPTESLPCLEVALDERADSLIEILALRDGQGAAESALCQLQFQILQALLQRAERDAFLGRHESRYCQLISADAAPIAQLLDEIVAVSGSKEAGTMWSGRPTQLRGRAELLQAVWLAIVTRWAPLLDRLADEALLARLAAAVMAASAAGEEQDTAKGCMRYISTTALRNAAFLELPNVRRHVIACIQQRVDPSGRDVESRLAATTALWLTPSEWIAKPARGALTAKLLALDRDIASAAHQQKGHAGTTGWTELRKLLARLLEADFATEADISDADLLSSLRTFVASDEQDPAWQRASLAVIRATVNVLLQRGSLNADIRSALVQGALEARRQASGDASHVTFRERAAQDMFAALCSGGVAESELLGADADRDVAQKSLEALKTLGAAAGLDTATGVITTLELALYHLREIRLRMNGTRSDASELGAAVTKDVVTALCILLGRGSLVSDADDAHAKLVRTAADVALELLRCLQGAPAAGACLAYSALVSSLPEVGEQQRVRDGLQRIVSRLDTEQYDATLSQLLAALSSASTLEGAGADADVGALIGTVGLVLGSAPEGTSKIARDHLAHWLSLLVGTTAGPVRVGAMVASVSALDLLCRHHAMLLRTQDVHAMMQLFATLVGPSARDEVSGTISSLPASRRDAVRSAIFIGIVSTLGSLMRLRQDLVLGGLPQLGALLARLCALFRRLKRTPSGMQRRQLRRDLPAWLDPVEVTPLGEHEARALSRLLSSLVAKNVSLKSRGDEGKAQSLAKPFSKHATYVLVAYLRSLTAPNAVVPFEVRAELEVGMLTLCGIMGHHQRDAAMVGMLDAAGKVLMKRIWSEYEKQRYKGQ